MALLELCGINKNYPGVRALAGVDFAVGAGEVHALLGENGAGKSTLMKVVAGTVRPDEGSLLIDGFPVPPGSPELARRSGVGVVHQELSLVPTLSAMENVLLGRWPLRPRIGVVDWRRLRARAEDLLERVGLGHIDPRQPVEELGIATRQLVEIAKALAGDVRVLLFDEPTSALSDPEAERLFDIIERLTEKGVGVVYVSHRLGEVLRVADRVTVLRDGHHVATDTAADVSEAQLAARMVGREIETGAIREGVESPAVHDEVVLRARGLGRPPYLRPFDLELRPGEIVGVFGLVGSGRSELGRTLFGLEPATVGALATGGRTARIASPAAAAAAGIGYVAAGRHEGIIPSMSAVQNVTLGALERISRGPFLDDRAESELGRHYIDELDIRLRAPDQPGGTLSGGNQQKIMLARWLASQSRILILDDPTRGIDVGAKAEVFRLVQRLAEDGVTVVYLTSEIKEAKLLAHRVLVMAGGEVVDELSPEAADERIMAAAGGARG